MKPSRPVKPSPVEEARNQRLAFFAKKREMFLVNAMVGLLQNPATKVENVEANADLALKYADTMFNRLYVAKAAAEEKADE